MSALRCHWCDNTGRGRLGGQCRHCHGTGRIAPTSELQRAGYMLGVLAHLIPVLCTLVLIAAAAGVLAVMLAALVNA